MRFLTITNVRQKTSTTNKKKKLTTKSMNERQRTQRWIDFVQCPCPKPANVYCYYLYFICSWNFSIEIVFCFVLLPECGSFTLFVSKCISIQITYRNLFILLRSTHKKKPAKYGLNWINCVWFIFVDQMVGFSGAPIKILRFNEQKFYL